MKIKDRVKAIHEAADANTGAVKKAFFQVIEEIRAIQFDTAALEIALAQQDVESAIRATQVRNMNDLLLGIGMDQTAYIFSHQVQNIFTIGAGVAIKNLPLSLQRAIAYDNLSIRAVEFLRNDVNFAISGLTSASEAGVRTAIERTLTEGTNPLRQVKIIRQLIGLTDAQTDAVLNFRAQLETRQEMGFTPPGDRRLSAVEQAVVRRHMKEGHLTDQQIDDLVERYYQSMLNKRASDIAVTESLNAINNGQMELWFQGVDRGLFDDNVDRKFWIVTRDDRLRATHAAIPTMNPNGVKIKSYFATPFGPVMSPGDRNINLINCRCVVVLGEYGQTYAQDGYIV